MEDLTQAMRDRLAVIEKEAAAIKAYLEGIGPVKPKISEQGLENIRKAQRARWAKQKAGKGGRG